MKSTIRPCFIALFLSAAFCLKTNSVDAQFQPVAKCLCPEGEPGSITLIGPSESGEGYSGPFEFKWSGPEGFIADTRDIDHLNVPGVYSVMITNHFGCEMILETELPMCDGIYFLHFATHPTCPAEASGAIDLTVVEGAGPFMFLWNTNAQTEDLGGLLPGIYSVMVTDELGCTFQDEAVLEELSPPQIQSSLIVNSCTVTNTGSILLEISGGEAPFSAQWTDGPTGLFRQNLAPGVYQCEITDANGCTLVPGVFEVLELPAPAITSYFIQPVSCSEAADGQISLLISSPSETYEVVWSDGAAAEFRTGLSAGQYCVTVTDENTCSTSACYTVGVDPDSPVWSEVYISGGKPALPLQCSGAIDLNLGNLYAPFDVSVTGPTPKEYHQVQGLLNITGLCKGTYTLVITNAQGCSLILSEEVTPCTFPQITVVDIQKPGYPESHDGAIVLADNYPAGQVNYYWSNGATGNSVDNLAPGEYVVSITLPNGCFTTRFFNMNACHRYELEPPDYTQYNIVENYTPFDLKIEGGLALPGEETIPVRALMRYQGQPDFEEIPSGFSIEWRNNQGQLLDQGHPSLELNVDQVFVLANQITAAVQLTVSDGCFTKEISKFLFNCYEGINSDGNLDLAAGPFFVVDQTLPCENASDGLITLGLPNTSDQNLSVYVNGINFPVENNDISTTSAIGGLSAGNQAISIAVGSCELDFDYYLPQMASDLAFNHYDKNANACFYNESCKGLDLGVLQVAGIYDIHNVSSGCSVPISCEVNGEVMEWEKTPKITSSVASYLTYHSLVRSSMIFPDEYMDFLLGQVLGLAPCDKITFCPVSLEAKFKWSFPFPFNPDIEIDGNGCAVVECPLAGDETVCGSDFDLFFGQYLHVPPPVNPCIPVTENLFHLIAADELGILNAMPGYGGSALQSLIDQHRNAPEAKCTYVTFCPGDQFRVIHDGDIENVNCDPVLPDNPLNIDLDVKIVSDLEITDPDIQFSCTTLFWPTVSPEIPICEILISHEGECTDDPELLDFAYVNCRNSQFPSGFYSVPIDVAYEPNFLPSLINEPIAKGEPKIISDFFQNEKLAAFGYVKSNGLSIPKGIVEAGDSIIFYDYTHRGSLVHKELIPNRKLFVADFDAESEVQLYEVAEGTTYIANFEDTLTERLILIESDEKLKIGHLSLEENGIVIAGMLEGNLSIDSLPVGSVNQPAAFWAKISKEGDLLVFNYAAGIDTTGEVRFSEPRNGELLFLTEFSGNTLSFDGAAIQMKAPAGVVAGKFSEVSGTELLRSYYSPAKLGTAAITYSQTGDAFAVAITNATPTYSNLDNEYFYSGQGQLGTSILYQDDAAPNSWAAHFNYHQIHPEKLDMKLGANNDLLLGLTMLDSLVVSPDTTLYTNGNEDIVLLKRGVGNPKNFELMGHYGTPEKENISRLFLQGDILFFGGEFSGNTPAKRQIGNYVFANSIQTQRAYISYVSIEPVEAPNQFAEKIHPSNSFPETDKQLSVQVYPNPFENKLHCSMNSPIAQNVHFQLFDLLGRPVGNLTIVPLTTGLNQLDIPVPNGLTPGFYEIKFDFAGSGEVVHLKLLRQNSGK